jgi:hypothetical protein
MRILETPNFSAARKRLLTQGEYADLLQSLTANPHQSDPLEGPVRRLRWIRRTRAHRTGGEIYVYYMALEPDAILMLATEAAKADLSGEQRRILRDVLTEEGFGL